MSGKEQDPPGSGEKNSPAAEGGSSERPRSISGSPPPTDDLDSEWDASPAEPEKKPSVRPAAVVVRTQPPAPMVARGTSSETTLLGVAPPPIVQIPKNDPLPRVETTPAPVAEVAPAVAESAPAKPDSDPVPAVSPPSEPVAAKQPEPEPAPANEKPKPKSVTAPRVETPPPDSVSASSTDHAERVIASSGGSIEPRRSGRGLWIAAAAALVAGGLWFGLRPSAHEASAPEPVAQTKPELATTPNAAQPTPSPAEPPAQPAPAEPPPTATVTAPAPEASAAASGEKKVVIVNARPATARFFYKGKKVGVSPLRVELSPGEKRSFEVGHPNFITRKVIVDGSEPEVTVGLYPKSGNWRKPAKASPEPTEPAEAAP